MDLRLRPIGAGAFRTVYHIVGVPLVVKFPHPGSDFWYNKIHTRTELARIRKFHRFKHLRRYLPKVYHYDPKTGISVVEFVDDRGLPGDKDKRRALGLIPLVQELIFRLTGTKMTDICADNVRYDSKKRVSKIVDLAY